MSFINICKYWHFNSAVIQILYTFSQCLVFQCFFNWIFSIYTHWKQKQRGKKAKFYVLLVKGTVFPSSCKLVFGFQYIFVFRNIEM